jgi:hypothetical protein
MTAGNHTIVMYPDNFAMLIFRENLMELKRVKMMNELFTEMKKYIDECK